jgi:hypothetical protein
MQFGGPVRALRVWEGRLIVVINYGEIKCCEIRETGFEVVRTVIVDGRIFDLALAEGRMVAWGGDSVIFVIEGETVVDYFEVQGDLWALVEVRGAIIAVGNQNLFVLEDRPGEKRVWPPKKKSEVGFVVPVMSVFQRGNCNRFGLEPPMQCPVYATAIRFIKETGLPLRHLEPIAEFLRERFEGTSDIQLRFGDPNASPVIGPDLTGEEKAIVQRWRDAPAEAFAIVRRHPDGLVGILRAMVIQARPREAIPPEALVEIIRERLLPYDVMEWPANAIGLLCDAFLRYADEVLPLVIEGRILERLAEVQSTLRDDVWNDALSLANAVLAYGAGEDEVPLVFKDDSRLNVPT